MVERSFLEEECNPLRSNGEPNPQLVWDTFGIAVASLAAEAEVVAQDWPNVLVLAKPNAIEAGIGDRHKTLPGDFFAVDLGENYDLVLLTNFFHHFDEQACVEVLKKINSSIAPRRQVAHPRVCTEMRIVSAPEYLLRLGMMMLG